jgi:hypothetical protein
VLGLCGYSSHSILRRPPNKPEARCFVANNDVRMTEANVRTAKLNGVSFKQRKYLANPGVTFFSLFLFVFIYFVS